MHERIELAGETRVEVVTHALGPGQIDDADGPLQTRFAQSSRGLAEIPQGQEELRGTGAVEEAFVAPRQPGTDLLPLGRPYPLGARGHGPGVRAEADEPRLARVPFARKLSDVDLAGLAHLRRARVTHVRIVRPDDD